LKSDDIHSLTNRSTIIGVYSIASKNGILALGFGVPSFTMITTFDTVSQNVALADFLADKQIRKAGLHLERLAGLLHVFYGYTLDVFFEINEKMGKERSVWDDGCHQSIKFHFDSIPDHPAYHKTEIIKPHEWLDLTDLSAVTDKHMKAVSVLTQMLHYIGKLLIINNAPSMQWTHFQRRYPTFVTTFEKICQHSNALITSQDGLQDIPLKIILSWYPYLFLFTDDKRKMKAALPLLTFVSIVSIHLCGQGGQEAG
jgi:hypothetical protein